jgi:phosphatidylserine/phosphatidylglycerophosphate/cardiolipin synthase-like enzyme
MGSIIFFFSCAKEEKYAPITEDFCSQIQLQQPVKLSDHLMGMDSLLQAKTGVYALEEGDVSMIARAWLTESAEQTIDIQYFIFSADNIGLIASDYLLRAADRGVKIRIIVDDIMVEADADELLAIDAHPNLSIKIYNPAANIGKNLPEKLYSIATDFRGFNQRMHNKTFIVDGKVVITGGRNIADEYFDYDHEYNFRDRDVLLLGKASNTVQESFNQFWDSPLSVPVTELVQVTKEELNLEVKYNWLHQYACNPENFWPQVREKIKAMPEAFHRIQQSGKLVWTDSVTFVSDTPGKNDGREGMQGGGATTDALVQLIREATSSVYIQSPYLITTALSWKLFKEAIDRGVNVTILTNSLASTDNLEAFNGYQRDREALLNIGVNIYEFKPDAAIRFEIMTGALQKKVNFTPVFGLHAKSVAIDQRVAVIGTFNLDPRSANLNTECITIIHDQQVAGALFHAIEADIRPENAWHTTASFNPDKEAGRVKRFKAWLRGVVPKSVL